MGSSDGFLSQLKKVIWLAPVWIVVLGAILILIGLDELDQAVRKVM